VFKRTLMALLFAAIATLVSSTIPGWVRDVDPGSMHCQQGCDVVAAGWPFPYIVDYHGLSPVGSADVLGALFGLDFIWPGAMAATFLFWLGLLVAVAWLGRWFARSRQ
jgi:hypothetical protein